MSNEPQPMYASFAAFALVDELIKTFVDRRILSKGDVVTLIENGARNLDGLGFRESQRAAAFLRSRITPEEQF